ncbi:MAG: helix-turn-helix transcriptional regulator [Pseudomonadota bacterium]
MAFPPRSVVIDKLRDKDAEVHSIQMSSDRSVLIFDASFPEREAEVRSFPALFAMMCMTGGGNITRRMADHVLDSVIEPGDIGIAAPSTPGYEITPEMRVIGFGIEVRALTTSLGEDWPRTLRKEVLSKPLRDPMVEATMMQIGYTNAGQISDSVLLHAAHMVVHQLCDAPVEPVNDPDKAPAYPLPSDTIDAIHSYVLDRIEQTITVEELAKHVGISRYHFSRRFRTATGQSPYQFILDLKLDHAAATLSDDRETKIIDAANMVGFRNPARFSEAFRRRFGQTPRKWRLSRN